MDEKLVREQLEAIERVRERVLKTKASARKFLQSIGCLDEKEEELKKVQNKKMKL